MEDFWEESETLEEASVVIEEVPEVISDTLEGGPVYRPSGKRTLIQRELGSKRIEHGPWHELTFRVVLEESRDPETHKIHQRNALEIVAQSCEHSSTNLRLQDLNSTDLRLLGEMLIEASYEIDTSNRGDLLAQVSEGVEEL